MWGYTAIKWASGHGRWDLVVSTFGPYINHIVAYKIKKNGLASNWIADFRDLWVDHHIYQGIWPFRKIEKIMEGRLMELASLITTVSFPLAQVLRHKYGQKVHVVENGFDPEDLELIGRKIIFPFDDKIRILYTGNIYPKKQDPSPLFYAISELNKDVRYNKKLKRLEVLFFGKNLDTIHKLITKYNVGPFVRCGGFVSRQTSMNMQRHADILLFLEWDHKKAEGVLTGKLFEYLWAGPVIWAIGIHSDSIAGKLISENGFGIVMGKNTEKIKQNLIDLLDGHARPTTLEQNKNKILNRYNRKVLAEKMLKLVA